MTNQYHIPTHNHQIELVISRSRFLSAAGYTPTVEAARAFIAAIKQEHPGANHHVYAFAVGFDASVTYGMSDDGEPSNTAGKPTLAVVKGSGLGDVTVVTTRYFGGIKLGTGGLVKAYTEAAQLTLSEIPRAMRVQKCRITVAVPYHLYEQVIRLVKSCNGQAEHEDFAVEVTLQLAFPVANLPRFTGQLSELSAGQIQVNPAAGELFWGTTTG